MTELSGAITLSAALLAGVAGSAHCVAMCGGLAGALSTNIGNTAGDRFAGLRHSILHNLGRLIGYAAAGSVFGLAGTALQSVLNLPLLTLAARLAAALLIMLVAARILLSWNALAAVERLGAHFWRRIQPLVRLAATSHSRSRSLLLGLLWGWLPCGLVYSMLLFAALSGNALDGAAIMLAFGLGTLPSMLASSVFASQLTRRLRQHGMRQMVGAVLLVFGLWLGWAAVSSVAPSTDHAHHLHHAAHHPAM